MASTAARRVRRTGRAHALLAAAAILAPAASQAATRNVDNADASCSDVSGLPFCTVQAAVTASTAGDVIEIAAGSYIELITVDRNLTLRGAGKSSVPGACDGQTSLLGAPALTVPAGVTAAVSGVTVKGSYATFGGGVSNAGVLSLADSEVCQNGTFFQGGGLYTSGWLNLLDVQVYDNTQASVGSAGGGLYVAAGGVVVGARSSFMGNRVSQGGGIAVAAGGALFLTDCVIEGNFADGTMLSLLPAQGGGLHNAGLAVLDRTQVGGRLGRGNAVLDPNGEGGGIYNDGALLLTRSAIASNLIDYVPGNLVGPAFGAGLYNSGVAALVSTTVSGNLFQPNLLAYGAGIATTDTLSLSNVTVSDNANGGAGMLSGGAGVYVMGGTATVRNSIIASQAAGDDCDGAVTTDGHNIDSDGTCGLVAASAGGTDQPSVADPGLLPLDDNGGPTLTHALTADSPAIDAGNPTCLADMNGVGAAQVPVVSDQRGNVLVDVPNVGAASGCDVGAVEFNLLANGMMEDGDATQAAGWTGTNLAAGDRLVCRPALAHEGRCAFRLLGDAALVKQIAQVVDRPGFAGDTYTVRLSAAGVNLTGQPRLRLQFDDLQTIGLDEEFILPLSTGTYDFLEHALEVTSAIGSVNGYDRVTAVVEGGTGGALRIDDLSLVPHP